MSTDQRFANVRFLCNGQDANEIQHNDGIVSGDMLSLRMQQIQHLVSLVYWCKDGWSRPDKVKVACMLKDFKSLKYFVTDTSQKQLLSLGFDRTVHNFLSSYMIERSKLVGGQNSRNWYIHVFSAKNLPIIQDCEFPYQETTDFIEKEILDLTTMMDSKKRSRRIGADLSNKRYVPEEGKGPSQTSRKKRKCSSSNSSKYLTGVNVETEKIEVPKYVLGVNVEKLLRNFDILDDIDYPDDCVNIKSKFQYISGINANSLKRKASSDVRYTPVDKVIQNIESASLQKDDILLLIEKLKLKVVSTLMN